MSDSNALASGHYLCLRRYTGRTISNRKIGSIESFHCGSCGRPLLKRGGKPKGALQRLPIPARLTALLKKLARLRDSSAVEVVTFRDGADRLRKLRTCLRVFVGKQQRVS